jgi:hypothetical protein
MKILMALRSGAGMLFLISMLYGSTGPELQVNDEEYLDTQGLSVLLYHNTFHPVFGDEKMSALEMILHGQRIATNGDVRLVPTPEQWDAVPVLGRRTADKLSRRLTAFCSYPGYSLSYRLEVAAEAGGLRVAIHLDNPLPKALIGRAGFNWEFLPSAYFGKSYRLDSSYGVIPRHPYGPMAKENDGLYQAQPLASGTELILSPEDPTTRVAITSEGAPLALYDGRNRAQNGWFVVRTLIPADRKENAVVWHVRPNLIAGWFGRRSLRTTSLDTIRTGRR